MSPPSFAAQQYRLHDTARILDVGSLYAKEDQVVAIYVIASKDNQDLVCDTGGLKYVPDPVRHTYGVSTRPSLEDWFLTELEFVRNLLPQHKIFTLGATCVFGEKFVTHLTICEVEMKPQAFEELRRAVRESDQAIRNKVGAMWKWDLCLMDHAQNRAALCIGWLDFAYFVKHRQDFLDASHNRFMGAFASGTSRSTDYKILHDGTIVEFDPNKLAPHERIVFERSSEIHFDVISRASPEQSESLPMV